MSITGIDAVIFGVTNRAKATKFLDHWGLRKTKTGKFGADYFCADGTEVKLRAHDNQRLPAAIQAGSTVREVIGGSRKKLNSRPLKRNYPKTARSK